MSFSIYISAVEASAGKSLVALGIIDFALRRTKRVGFFRPVAENDPGQDRDEDIELILSHFGLAQDYESSYGVLVSEALEMLGGQRVDEILERIVSRYKALEENCDLLVVEGTDYLTESTSPFEFNFNREIAKNLACPVLIVGSADRESIEDALAPVRIAVDSHRFRGTEVLGVVLNKCPMDWVSPLRQSLQAQYGEAGWLIGVIPFDQALFSPRVGEVAEQMYAEVLYGHTRLDEMVFEYLVAAMQTQHALEYLKENQLVITSGDRADIILALLQADQSAKYPQLAGLLLSGGFRPEPSVARLIDGLPDPLPILSVPTDTFTTAARVSETRTHMRPGDTPRMLRSIELFDGGIDLAPLAARMDATRPPVVTPKMFTYQLLKKARANKRHIVLPEGTDPRILRAASILLTKEAVRLTLLGRREEIASIAKKQRITLDLDALSVIDPVHSERLDDYAATFHQLRQHKGITAESARDVMLDVSYFGTMMVYQGDADGMVSGATHTTQHTLRPALQFIRTKPGFSIVSSVFFMCLDDGVVAYGDCAVNPDPTAEQLAEIAISSADTAAMFGIEPRVALLSYSSGSSGEGADVDKVRRATSLARERRPDLKLEGPIQYDAAVDPQVAAQKLPGSAVAGQATVFVFPDLNTGNNTYKAVQRESGAIAIGPILQGLRKPVNDLSRGCTVEDIVNTVVITAIQASAEED
ncbi:MAG: phosphate acetyltransferase [Methylotetracoccus sp.]